MDVLSTKGWAPELIAAAIEAQEGKWHGLRAENDRIRAWAKDNTAWLEQHPEIDVNAALVSDCRSDRLSCGRCAFYRAVERAKA